MTQPFDDAEDRLKKSKTWNKRITALVKLRQKKSPDYSEAQFCRDHDFDRHFLNRVKHRKGGFPDRATVDKIEMALAAEGI